jgi:hypothetical protein
VVACVLLVLLLAGAAVTVRRAGGRIREAQAAGLNVRVDRDRLEAQLARERAAREALSLELTRQRGRASDVPEVPTLTLEPSRKRQATPPEATVVAVAAEQVVLLRLILPSNARENGGYHLTARDWSSGQIRWTRSGLASVKVENGRAVVANVTGEMLVPGSYEVLVSLGNSGDGLRTVCSYELTIAGGQSL